MPLNDVLQDVAAREGVTVAAQEPRTSTAQAEQRRRGTVNGASLVQLEKTDLHFWVDVATLVVLLLILTKV